MQTDVVNLCLMAIITLAGFALASRSMGRGRGYPGSGTGGTRTPSTTGGRRGSAGGGYPGRQGGQLFPQRGDQQQPTARQPDAPASPPAGSSGSVFPQSDSPRRGGGFESGRDDNGYAGRQGGSLFPPRDGS
jgi:hypothetical protein